MSGPTPRLRRALIGAALVFAACTPSPAAPTSTALTESSAAEAGNLPPGCEPIDLRTTSGQTVDLNGIWIQGDEGDAVPAKWWIRTLGACVWGAGIVDEYSEEAFVAVPSQVQTLKGTIGNDFIIDGEIVLVGPRGVFEVPILAEVRILIEFGADGQVILREDRVPGVQGPRCPDPVGYCPAPLLLRPAA